MRFRRIDRGGGGKGLVMRLAFMGTPAFSVPALVELIAAGHDVAAVYTQPPRPAGRGQKLTKSPVHEMAESHGIDVRHPETLREPADRAAFAALDLDLAVVVAYGLILPRAVLEAPRLGCINLHASMLPRWRGAAPMQRAIMAGDTVTAMQVMQMEKGLDTGPVLLSETVPIAPDETAGSLHDRLASIGADMLPRALAALERGSLEPTPQTEDGVTYAEKISSAEAQIDWRRPAHEVDCHIRGLSPVPGAWFELAGKDGKPVRCKALMSRPAEGGGAPGTVLETGKALVIACGEGAVALTRLQRAGKGVQPAEDFLRGTQLSPGDRVE